MDENQNLLHDKVDVISSVVTQLVEFDIEYMNQLAAKSEKDSKVFDQLEDFSSGIKESMSKVDLSQQTITQ